MRADICKLLGIKYPIIMGGMTLVSGSDLMAAVSNAGGLGIFATGDKAQKGGSEWIRGEIRRIKELTDKPFGVNVAMFSPIVKEIIDLVCEETVALVTTGGGSPAPYMEQLKAAGVRVCPVVPSVEVARKMEAMGADMLVAEGAESGGFIGKVTTIVLAPQVTAAVNIPVIAAGGIADGRGLAAAYALGASGIQMGTQAEAAWLLTLKAAALRQQGQPCTTAAAMAKWYAAEAACYCCDLALQIHGGYGYMKDYPIERMYRDARILRIYEGTSEVQKMVIARAVMKG